MRRRSAKAPSALDLRAIGDTARAAADAGLVVNAGHDLNLRNIAADAGGAVPGGGKPPVTALPQAAQPPARQPAEQDSLATTVEYDAHDAAPPSSYGSEPDVPDETPAFRRIRPTAADVIADTPMPDFISSPGLSVSEQKPRPGAASAPASTR